MRKRFIDDMELPLENEIEVIPEKPEPPKVYTITLADGQQLTDLGLNGNNYVSQTRVDESFFKDNLSVMTVFDGETETVYHNVALVQQQEWPDGTWYLCFRERGLEEMRIEALEEAMLAMAKSLTEE